MSFTEKDVLLTAIEILKAGPLPGSHIEHGAYCPYCALSVAKGQLDTRHEVKFDCKEMLTQVLNGEFVPLATDTPLINARNALGKVARPYTREASIVALKCALKRVGAEESTPASIEVGLWTKHYVI